MKSILRIVLLSITVVATATAFAGKPIPGPKGGKIVTTEAPHVELFVAPDRTVVVSFYDKDLKPITIADQLVSAVVEAKSGKANLSFIVKNGGLVSSNPLPEGDGYRIVLQVRDNAQARPKNYRIEYHDEVCGECKRAEYACICDDAGGDKHNH